MPEPRGDPDQDIPALLAQLSQDARAFAAAEMRYARAELSERAALALPAVAMLAVAAVLAFATLVALLIGLVVALTPFLSAIGATGLVCVVAAVVIVTLYLVSAQRLRKAFKTSEDPWPTQ